MFYWDHRGLYKGPKYRRRKVVKSRVATGRPLIKGSFGVLWGRGVGGGGGGGGRGSVVPVLAVLAVDVVELGILLSVHTVQDQLVTLS